jgi:putative flippase GtrA
MTRFLKFSAAGAFGFIVQIGVVAALVGAGLHYVPATVAGVEAAIVVNFLWHEHWTWRDRPAANVRQRWLRLVRLNAVAGLTSIVGGVVITMLLVETLGIPAAAANVTSVAVLSMANFIGADTLVFRSAAGAVIITLASAAQAGEGTQLQPKTVAGFQKYAATVEARRARDLALGGPFLEVERQSAADQARIMAMLRRGEIVVEQGGGARGEGSNEIAIDGGLINHWRGAVFVPKVTLDRVLAVLQSPDTGNHKQEDLLWSKIVPNADGSQKLIARITRTKFVTVVYDTEYNVRYTRVGGDRAASDSRSTKIVEVENAGTASERALPEGDDHGYMWRLNSYWRYKQVGDGVLIEVESLTLSRGLPPLVGPLVRPIVNSTARESMTRTLSSLRARFG